MEVEKEHTDDPEIAKRIAEDHVTETEEVPKVGYYEALKVLEEFLDGLKDVDEPRKHFNELKKFVEQNVKMDKTGEVHVRAEEIQNMDSDELMNKLGIPDFLTVRKPKRLRALRDERMSKPTTGTHDMDKLAQGTEILTVFRKYVR
jgi:hypothetical protein